MFHSRSLLGWPLTRIVSIVVVLSSLASASPLDTRQEDALVAGGPRPYVVNVNADFVAQTRSKVKAFRNSQDVNAPAWVDGPPASQIGSIAQYWGNTYDWNKVQAEINRNFTHFYTTVPAPGGGYTKAVDLHFIHQKSKNKNAIPILFLHGWPSTSLLWKKIIPRLVAPEGANQPSFNVVAPDLPGFGFSPALTGSRVSLGRKEYAKMFASLMAQLGYDKYVVYSSDLGFPIALSIVVDYKKNVINHVTEFYAAFPTADDQARFAAGQTTAEESAYIQASGTFFNGYAAYQSVHATFPLAISYAMNDSPVGFLAWIYQIAQAVSDKPLQTIDLITDTFLLYLPGAYGNIRSYKELFSPASLAPEVPFTVPTSVLQFGGYNFYPGYEASGFAPRAWVERSANVTYFSRHDKGGHFPALSEPELVLADLRKIFSS